MYFNTYWIDIIVFYSIWWLKNVNLWSPISVFAILILLGRFWEHGPLFCLGIVYDVFFAVDFGYLYPSNCWASASASAWYHHELTYQTRMPLTMKPLIHSIESNRTFFLNSCRIFMTLIYRWMHARRVSSKYLTSNRSSNQYNLLFLAFWSIWWIDQKVVTTFHNIKYRQALLENRFIHSIHICGYIHNSQGRSAHVLSLWQLMYL